MRKCYLSYNNIISNLGFDSETVVEKVSKGISGLAVIEEPSLLAEKICAAIISSEEIAERFSKIGNPQDFTKLEQLMILSLNDVIRRWDQPLDETVGLLLSTTKGNIDVLEKESEFPHSRAYLDELGKIIGDFFGFKSEPVVVSNACVSGILSLSVAKRLIEEEKYKHVLVASGDVVTQFIVSGFNSFQALSKNPCKPYDKDREGINLGEAAASILVTSEFKNLPAEAVEIMGDATCNDANHISGPSRTGEGLVKSMERAMAAARIEASEIDYISAHGTATSFNDEMEAIAFNRMNLQEVPLNSLKGYFGHTLGAAGLLETIVGMHSLAKNTVFASKGFQTMGISRSLEIATTNISKPLEIFLKTASGFGGCNTATIFKKTTN